MIADKYAYVSEIIKRHIQIKTHEKEQFGEVFTPLDMIDYLLDHFPAHVWKNTEFTWIDPAVGIGAQHL